MWYKQGRIKPLRGPKHFRLWCPIYTFHFITFHFCSKLEISLSVKKVTEEHYSTYLQYLREITLLVHLSDLVNRFLPNHKTWYKENIKALRKWEKNITWFIYNILDLSAIHTREHTPYIRYKEVPSLHIRTHLWHLKLGGLQEEALGSSLVVVVQVCLAARVTVAVRPDDSHCIILI